jgi:DNA-binding NarL/FixJ family response regulator
MIETSPQFHIRVAIVDDHPMMREGIMHALGFQQTLKSLPMAQLPMTQMRLQNIIYRT